MYCPTHGASICWMCATTDHRQCPEVTKLETKMEEARAALAEMAVTLSAGETELKRAISQLDQHRKWNSQLRRSRQRGLRRKKGNLPQGFLSSERTFLPQCDDVLMTVSYGQRCSEHKMEHHMSDTTR